MIKKYYRFAILVFSLSLLVALPGFAQTQMLVKGDAAPVFSTKASLAGTAFDFSLKNALAAPNASPAYKRITWARSYQQATAQNKNAPPKWAGRSFYLFETQNLALYGAF